MKRVNGWAQALALLGFFATLGMGRAQDDLDSLDRWVRDMHPAPFLRCEEQTWKDALEETRERWLELEWVDKVRATNALLQVLQDSHTAVSGWHWVRDVEREWGTVPVMLAIEGRALWVRASASPNLPEHARVLSINGLDAESCIAAGIDLASMEGPSTKATERNAVHGILPYVMAHTRSDSVTVAFVRPGSGLPEQCTLPGLRPRQARGHWKSLVPFQPVVDWTFPDRTGLTRWDTRRLELREEMHVKGHTVLKINSFSDGGWRKFHRRLDRGFDLAETWGAPLVLDLRGNLGGMSPRMEALWNHVALTRTALPTALVAKQSRRTLRSNQRAYKGFRKRWVDNHLQTSEEAKYIYQMATLPLGEVDTLQFRPQPGPNRWTFRGPVALIIDGESASATVSFAGAFQATGRGPVLGEACMGPAVGTMGNPHLMTLPHSRIVVSISTAVYMAQECRDWAATTPIQPDVPFPAMWQSEDALKAWLTEWEQAPNVP